MAQHTPDEKFAEVNGLRLHYLEWAKVSQPALIMLHGLRSFAHSWEPVAQPLADKYRVLALDQRGRGESDWSPTAEYDAEAYVSDLAQLVDQLDLKSFYLMGHSMGGRNTLVYTVRHPERVKAAVIVDFGPPTKSWRARVDKDLETTPLEFASWEDARAFLRERRGRASEEALNARLSNMLKSLPNGKIGWKYDIQGITKARASASSAPQQDIWSVIRAISCPVLLVRGSHSEMLTRENASAMAAANSHFHSVEVPDAAHHVYEDNLSFFNTLVGTFLNQALAKGT